MLPWSTATGIAEKTQPRPMEPAMTVMMIRSSTAFTARMLQSPWRPSRMEPTIAMAPMHTVRDAVTKASTKPLSEPLPVFCFSQEPKRSRPSSIRSNSPTRVPRARQITTRMLPEAVTAPSSTVSICSRAPEMAMKMVLMPQALVRPSRIRSGRRPPTRRPSRPPATMAATLISVPRPLMPSFPS